MPNFPSSMPYDDVKIIDQSEYIQTTDETPVSEIPTGPVAFCPFISPRGYGEDNKLKYMNSTLLAKYGTPNLKKYGISLYLAKRFIDGGGTVLGMRLMPSDAECASKTIYATISDPAPLYKNEWVNMDKADDIIAISNITVSGSAEPSIIKNDKTHIEFKEKSLEITSVNNKNVYWVNTTNAADGDVTSIDEKIGYFFFKETTTSDSGNTTTYYAGKPTSVEIDSDDGKTTKHYFESLYTIANPVNASYIKYTTTKPEEKYYDVLTVSAKAAGEFGNAFRFRLTTDDTMNTTPSIIEDNVFFYKFIDSENGNKLDENMTFTFDDDYIYGTDCMSIEDVFSTYSENVKMIKSVKRVDEDAKADVNYQGGFEEFKAKIIEMMAAPDTKDSNNKALAEQAFNGIDILFGSISDKASYNTAKVYIVVDNSTNPLNTTSGIALEGGKDGFKDAALDAVAWSEGEYTDKFASLFVSAYTGASSDLLYDEVRYPFTYIFAPSYDDKVIEAIADLVSNRRITRVNLFTPKFDTYDKVLSWVDSNYSKFTGSGAGEGKTIGFKATIVSEWGLVKDPFTNKKTYMPSVYFDSYYMPRHWITAPGKPYAGRANYAWSGFITGSLTPQTVKTNNYVNNHNKGINTMLEDGLGYASPYEQITAQQAVKTSALSEINNSITLVEMIRIALKVASDNRWTDLGDNEVTAYRNKVETAISLALTGCYDTMNVIAERETVNGAGRNRIHCRVNVKFKDMLKGVSYEFYILAN